MALIATEYVVPFVRPVISSGDAVVPVALVVNVDPPFILN